MPQLNLFRNLGLFVRQGFFERTICSQLQSKMFLAESEKALIVSPDGQGDMLDEEIRRVLSVNAEESSKNMVWDAIWNLKPDLEDHFHVQLRGSEAPVFLRYGKGAFYRPHQDGDPNKPTSTKDRRVSVVIFLNDHSEEPAPNSYGGGALTFYGLLGEPGWKMCPLPLDAEPGLLIAFRSDTLHEVRPVTFGERFTIANWFSA